MLEPIIKSSDRTRFELETSLHPLIYQLPGPLGGSHFQKVNGYVHFSSERYGGPLTASVRPLNVIFLEQNSTFTVPPTYTLTVLSFPKEILNTITSELGNDVGYLKMCSLSSSWSLRVPARRCLFRSPSTQLPICILKFEYDRIRPEPLFQIH